MKVNFWVFQVVKRICRETIAHKAGGGEEANSLIGPFRFGDKLVIPERNYVISTIVWEVRKHAYDDDPIADCKYSSKLATYSRRVSQDSSVFCIFNGLTTPRNVRRNSHNQTSMEAGVE